MTDLRGDRVPGSALYRDWCAGCGEAIRVPKDALDRERNYCRGCIPPARNAEPPRRGGREGAAADREYDGGWFGAGEW